jgi:hypothetical protein
MAVEVQNLVFRFKMPCNLVSTVASQQSAASVFIPQSRTAASQQSAASVFTPQSRTPASQQSATSILTAQSRTQVYLWCHMRPISGPTIPNSPAPSLPFVICGRHWLTALFRYPSVILMFPIHPVTFAKFPWLHPDNGLVTSYVETAF